MKKVLILIAFIIPLLYLSDNANTQIVKSVGGGVTASQIITQLQNSNPNTVSATYGLQFTAANNPCMYLRRTGITGEEGTLYIDLQSHLVGLKIVSNLTYAGDLPTKPTQGYAYIKWLANGRMKITYVGSPGDVQQIKQWKNVTDGRPTIYDTFYAGDDFYFDDNADGVGGDSVYFDTSGEDALMEKAIPTFAPWPDVGDSLVPYSYWNDQTYNDMIADKGQQGELQWLVNSHDAEGATSNSAGITFLNQNWFGMPAIMIAGASGGSTTGELYGWTGITINGAIRSSTFTFPPETPIIGLKVTDSDVIFGATDQQYDLFTVNSQTDFTSYSSLRIPRGSDWPSNPKEGSIFYKTTNDTLGVYNGDEWMIVPMVSR